MTTVRFRVLNCRPVPLAYAEVALAILSVFASDIREAREGGSGEWGVSQECTRSKPTIASSDKWAFTHARSSKL